MIANWKLLYHFSECLEWTLMERQSASIKMQMDLLHLNVSVYFYFRRQKMQKGKLNKKLKPYAISTNEPHCERTILIYTKKYTYISGYMPTCVTLKLNIVSLMLVFLTGMDRIETLLFYRLSTIISIKLQTLCHIM